MMTTNIHPLLATAMETRDSFALGVYADWLEQDGDPLAVGWRKLAESAAWPKRKPAKNVWPVRDGQYLFAWVDGGRFPALSGDLPKHVFVELKAKWSWGLHGIERHYDTLL